MTVEMNIETMLERFRGFLSVIRGLRPLTVRRYTRAVERFFEWYLSRGVQGGKPGSGPPPSLTASLDVSLITAEDIEAWLKDLYYHHANFQNVSRSSKLSALKVFWQWLLARGLIQTGPVSLIPSPRVVRPMPKKFTTSQLSRIFGAPDVTTPRGIRDLAILKTLYGTGPRVNEIRGLNLDDVHPSGPSSVYLHYQTKGGKERMVRLARNPSEALLRWCAIREAHAAPGVRALFVSLQQPTPGTRLSNKAYNSILKKYAAAIGITTERVFVHRMRTTFATDLYDLGYNILEISIQMGHSGVETTQRYIAVSERALKKTAIPEKRWRELEKMEERRLSVDE